MAEPTHRVVAGRVDKDGKKVSGEGFDSSREDNGKYHITFRPSFGAVFGCAVSQVGFPDGGNDTRDNALPYAIENGSMHVATGGSNGSKDNRPFTFVVVGS